MDSLNAEIQLEIDQIYEEYVKKVKQNWTPEEIERFKAPLQFTAFEKSAILFYIEQSITKINLINREINGKSKIVELPPSQPPLNRRLNEDFCNKLYDKETLQPILSCYEAMTITKFQKDVDLTRCALETCLTELRDNNRFAKLVDFIHGEKQEAHDERTVIDQFNANLKILNELQQKQVHEQQENENRLDNARVEVFRLKNECDDRRKTAQMEEAVVGRWEAARQQQAAAIFNHELKNITQQRDELDEKTERELIANNETMAFYRASCDQLKHDIDVWQRRFETEKTDLDERIEFTLAQIADVRSEYQTIQALHKERELFIDDYHREQAKLAEQLQLEENKAAAAVRMQAWWRGTMVRQQLGPYRPKKKSKKPKTGKK